MPQNKSASVFIVCTLSPNDLSERDERQTFFSSLEPMVKAIAPPTRFVSVIEHGATGDNLHWNYAAEWDNPIYLDRFRRKLRKVYDDLSYTRNTHTIGVKACHAFYGIVGGYLEKEENYVVLNQFGIDEALRAAGQLRYVKSQQKKDKRKKDKSARDAWADSVIDYATENRLRVPDDIPRLHQLIVNYHCDVWGKEKGPCMPLTSMFAKNAAVWTLAIKLGIPRKDVFNMFVNM